VNSAPREPLETGGKMTYCTSCGALLAGRFCGDCGSAASRASTATATLSAYRELSEHIEDEPSRLEPSTRRRWLGKGLLIAALSLVVLVGVSVPAGLLYQHHRQSVRNDKFLAKTQAVMHDNGLQVPDRVLLSMGQAMCKEYLSGASFDEVTNEWSQQGSSSPAPSNETLEEFSRRIAGPMTQALVTVSVGAVAATQLCPGTGAMKK
jgi:hypothetical protein